MTKPTLLIAAAVVVLSGCGETNVTERSDQDAAGAQAGSASQAEAQPGVRPAATATVAVASKEEVGEYLVDGEGRALYVLEGNRAGPGGQTGRTCTGACLEEWPPLTSQGTPQADQGIDSGKLGIVTRDGVTQVTYAGWPLYYYRGDRGPGMISGQDVHDRWGGWYLLTPAGERIEGGE